MYAEVILSQRLPQQLGIFDYQVPDALEGVLRPGHFVQIPFRARVATGIVLHLKETAATDKNIKLIRGLVDDQPLLTPEQLELAKFIAEYYFVSLGAVIKSMVPPVPKRRTKAVQVGTADPSNPQPLFKKVVGGKASQQQLIISFDRDAALAAVTETIQSNGSALVIVPEKNDVDEWQKILPADLKQRTITISSGLADGKVYRTWKKIQDTAPVIVIGTKLAAFAPMTNLKLIVVDQEDNRNHKQSDQNPRFDTRTVASQLATLHHARLLFRSPAPTVIRYAACPGDKAPAVNDAWPALKIVDMREERKAKNFSVFSEALAAALDASLSQQKKVLLFINKRGSASAIVCRDCGHTMTCGRCGSVMAYHERSKSLYCHRCNNAATVPDRCPDCRSSEIRPQGLGSQRLETEARLRWPHHTVNRIDQDTAGTKKISWADITVATEKVFTEKDIPAFDTIGLVSADTYYHVPDYRAEERTWQLLHNVGTLGQSLIIQTYNPRTVAIQCYANKDVARFYQTELAQRRESNYPPFGNLIKCTYLHPDKKTCLTEATKLYRVFKSSPIEASILTPLQTVVRGKWQLYLVVRFSDPEIDMVRKLLQRVPEGWTIDRDPESLL